MDFPFIFFLIIAWIVFSNIKGASKGLSKAAQKTEKGRKSLAEIQAKIKDAALRDEFETNFERQDNWADMSPTERGRERERQRSSYPGAQTSFGQSPLQKRLEQAQKLSQMKRKAQRDVSVDMTGVDMTGRGVDFGLNSRHAPQKDQNRHRRDDWGQRGGGEVITTKSLLVLFGLGFIVLYVLSKVSPSDIGL